jgi:hypothetical protein
LPDRVKKPWASLDNTWSVWLTGPSLSNALQDSGFSSVFTCEVPAMTGRIHNRQTFVALKGTPVTIASTPPVNLLPPERASESGMTTRPARWLSWLSELIRSKIAHWRRR